MAFAEMSHEWPGVNYLLSALPAMIVLIVLYIVFSTIIITNPYYYVDPISQLNNQYQNLQDFQSVLSDMYSTWSPLQKFYMPFLGTFSVTIYPVIDAYYYVFGAENIPQSVVNGYAFVSVPLTILFFVGTWYLLRKTSLFLSSKNHILTGRGNL